MEPHFRSQIVMESIIRMIAVATMCKTYLRNLLTLVRYNCHCLASKYTLPVPLGTHFFSSKPWSTKAVTTLSFGNRCAKFDTPSGLAIRFRKRMRSSGTPRDLSTSTAIMADPPSVLIRRTSYRWPLQDIPVANMGSNSRTHLSAMSSGSLS